MKQIGIIYKFTIIAKYKFDGHKPFYVGQHFGLENFDSYPGSGSIWGDFIKRLKQDYPNHWRIFIRREVLYQRPCSQLVLNKMEEYFIKHEKSHYSYKLGGCNVLWGAAIENNPAKDEFVKNKMRINKKKLFSSEKGEITRKKMSESHYNCSKDKNPTFNTKWITNGTNSKRIKLGLKIPDGWYYGNSNVIGKNNPMFGRRGKSHPNYGKKRTPEQIAKISGKNNPMYGKTSPFKGKHLSEEAKKTLSEKAKARFKNKENNPMFGKVRINNGKINKVINQGDEIPTGFVLGMLRYEKKNNPMYGKRFRWINNGIRNKRFDLEEKLPKGWKEGYIRKKNENKSDK